MRKKKKEEEEREEKETGKCHAYGEQSLNRNSLHDIDRELLGRASKSAVLERSRWEVWSRRAF